MTGEDFDVLAAIRDCVLHPAVPPEQITLDLILGARYSGDAYQRGAEWEAVRSGYTGEPWAEKTPCTCECHEDITAVVEGDDTACALCGGTAEKPGVIEGPPTADKLGQYPTNRERTIRSLKRLVSLGLVHPLPTLDVVRAPDERAAAPAGSTWEHRAMVAELTVVARVFFAAAGMDTPARPHRVREGQVIPR